MFVYVLYLDINIYDVYFLNVLINTGYLNYLLLQNQCQFKVIKTK